MRVCFCISKKQIFSRHGLNDLFHKFFHDSEYEALRSIVGKLMIIM